jgi:hypothetical protein
MGANVKSQETIQGFTTYITQYPDRNTDFQDFISNSKCPSEIREQIFNFHGNAYRNYRIKQGYAIFTSRNQHQMYVHFCYCNRVNLGRNILSLTTVSVPFEQITHLGAWAVRLLGNIPWEDIEQSRKPEVIFNINQLGRNTLFGINQEWQDLQPLKNSPYHVKIERPINYQSLIDCLGILTKQVNSDFSMSLGLSNANELGIPFKYIIEANIERVPRDPRIDKFRELIGQIDTNALRLTSSLPEIWKQHIFSEMQRLTSLVEIYLESILEQNTNIQFNYMLAQHQNMVLFNAWLRMNSILETPIEFPENILLQIPKPSQKTTRESRQSEKLLPSDFASRQSQSNTPPFNQPKVINEPPTLPNETQNQLKGTQTESPKPPNPNLLLRLLGILPKDRNLAKHTQMEGSTPPKTPPPIGSNNKRGESVKNSLTLLLVLTILGVFFWLVINKFGLPRNLWQQKTSTSTKTPATSKPTSPLTK